MSDVEIGWVNVHVIVKWSLVKVDIHLTHP